MLRREQAAKFTQLGLEYDPQPPFHAGSPQSAAPELTAALRQGTGGMGGGGREGGR